MNLLDLLSKKTDRRVRKTLMLLPGIEGLETRVVLTRIPSITTLTATALTTSFGQPEAFTAQVQANGAGPAPTGTIQFLVNFAPVGNPVPLSSAGTATFNDSTLPVGSDSVTAYFYEDGSGFDSSSVIVIPITPVTPQLVVHASAPQATLGQSETLTANVSSGPGLAIPSGSVQFQANGSALGAPVVLVAGQASMSTTAIPAGAPRITAVYSPDSANFASTNTSTNPLALSIANPVSPRNPALENNDFDSDGKADLTIYGPIGSTGKYGFQVLTSSSGFNPGQAVVFDNNGWGFGNKASIPVAADYFGDGKSAYALWTPNNLGGMTFTAVSSVVAGKTISVNFGETNDVPVIADVDGDGKADFGVYGYQPGLGYRFDFLLSSDNFNVNQQDVFNNNGYGYGNSKSIPVVADFDGSGKAGFGLFNPSTSGSTFTYVSPSANVSFTRTVGNATDIPMAVNYDGDNKADLALYGPDTSTGKYRFEVLTSSSNYNPSQVVLYNNHGSGYGNAQSIPTVADYQGAGKDDLAVYTTDFNGGMVLNYQQSQTGSGVTVDFGTTGDISLASPSYLRAKLVRGQS